jgi:hypothetical protein
MFGICFASHSDAAHGWLNVMYPMYVFSLYIAVLPFALIYVNTFSSSLRKNC